MLTAVISPAGARADDPSRLLRRLRHRLSGAGQERGCVIVKVEEGTQTYTSSQLTVIDHAFFILMYYIQTASRTTCPCTRCRR